MAGWLQWTPDGWGSVPGGCRAFLAHAWPVGWDWDAAMQKLVEWNAILAYQIPHIASEHVGLQPCLSNVSIIPSHHLLPMLLPTHVPSVPTAGPMWPCAGPCRAENFPQSRQGGRDKMSTRKAAWQDARRAERTKRRWPCLWVASLAGSGPVIAGCFRPHTRCAGRGCEWMAPGSMLPGLRGFDKRPPGAHG